MQSQRINRHHHHCNSTQRFISDLPAASRSLHQLFNEQHHHPAAMLPAPPASCRRGIIIQVSPSISRGPRARYLVPTRPFLCRVCKPFLLLGHDATTADYPRQRNASCWLKVVLDFSLSHTHRVFPVQLPYRHSPPPTHRLIGEPETRG